MILDYDTRREMLVMATTEITRHAMERNWDANKLARYLTQFEKNRIK